MKTTDADWVEDVRRWYFNGGPAASLAGSRALPSRTAPGANDGIAADIGYEAAHPSLQAAAWAKPAATGFGSLG